MTCGVTSWVWLARDSAQGLVGEFVGLSTRERVSRAISWEGITPLAGSARPAGSLSAILRPTRVGGRGCLSKGSEAEFIKITLPVPHGAEAAPPPWLTPASHTSSEIRQAQSLIISEITKAALVTPAAEAASAQLAFIIFQGKSCIHQSQAHSAECPVVG